jgi:hypothetical protein
VLGDATISKPPADEGKGIRVPASLLLSWPSSLSRAVGRFRIRVLRLTGHAG